MIREASKSDIILMGDFNCNVIDWISNYCDNFSVDSMLFLKCVNKCFVTKLVTDFTTDNSTLDLLLSRDPNMVGNVQVSGSFHTSDHELLSYNCCYVPAKFYESWLNLNTDGKRRRCMWSMSIDNNFETTDEISMKFCMAIIFLPGSCLIIQYSSGGARGRRKVDSRWDACQHI